MSCGSGCVTTASERQTQEAGVVCPDEALCRVVDDEVYESGRGEGKGGRRLGSRGLGVGCRRDGKNREVGDESREGRERGYRGKGECEGRRRGEETC